MTNNVYLAICRDATAGTETTNCIDANNADEDTCHGGHSLKAVSPTLVKVFSQNRYFTTKYAKIMLQCYSILTKVIIICFATCRAFRKYILRRIQYQ